jgi:hypothetical protein
VFLFYVPVRRQNRWMAPIAWRTQDGRIPLRHYLLIARKRSYLISLKINTKISSFFCFFNSVHGTFWHNPSSRTMAFGSTQPPLVYSVRTSQETKCACVIENNRLMLFMEIIGFFSWRSPSSHTMALGSTQPLTEMSARTTRPQRRPCTRMRRLKISHSVVICKMKNIIKLPLAQMYISYTKA